MVNYCWISDFLGTAHKYREHFTRHLRDPSRCSTRDARLSQSHEATDSSSIPGTASIPPLLSRELETSKRKNRKRNYTLRTIQGGRTTRVHRMAKLHASGDTVHIRLLPKPMETRDRSNATQESKSVCAHQTQNDRFVLSHAT